MTGSTVGPYRLLGRLGSGGMGEVFLGHDPRLQRKVALKSLTSADAAGGGVRERILHEARAAARLNHPHIAAVYDVVEQDDRAFIVMEYVEGESLARRLAREPFPIERVATLGQQLASALAAAHAQGVIHRDLKPANIQLTPDGSIKVLDFGVARLSVPVASPTATTAGVDTEASTFGSNPGTLVYMAPEQLLGRRVDARSDIYSLGVVLFEIVTGRRPYMEKNAIELALAMSTTPAPSADSVNPSVPPGLSGVIAKALERDPANRYQSAHDLEAAIAGGAVEPAARGAWRRAWKLAAAAAIVLTLGSVAGRPLLMRTGLFKGAPLATRPAVVAILPVENPTGDPQAEYLGAGFASVVAGNFGSIPGLSVLSRGSTAPYEKQRGDLSALQRELGADYVVDLTVKSARPSPLIVARLRRPGTPSPIWEQTIGGEALAVERTLLDGLGRALERAGALPRRLTRSDWTRIGKLPTTASDALMAYSEARALLDRYDSPANIDAAIALLGRAMASDPGFALAQAAMGDAYFDKYQSERDPALVGKATDAVMQAIRMDPDQAAVYYSLGNMQHVTGRPEQAVGSLRQSLVLQPDSDETHRLLGQVLADQGDVDAGVAELRQAIRIRPQYSRNYMTLGLVYYRAGRYREALEPYRRASELQPTEAGPFSSLGTIYHRLGEIDRAIGYYEHAVRLGPNAAAHANLALAYYTVTRYDDALQEYQASLSANPRSAFNRRNIGDVYQRLKQPEKARAEYEQAITIGNELVKVNARDFRTIALIALCEAKLGRRADAERHAAEARAIGPADRETLQRIAEVHARLGHTATALKDLEAAIARGYARKEARENDELAPLRKLPAFVALVAESRDSTNR